LLLFEIAIPLLPLPQYTHCFWFAKLFISVVLLTVFHSWLRLLSAFVSTTKTMLTV